VAPRARAMPLRLSRAVRYRVPATGESAAISSTSHASASRTAVRSSALRHCGANTRTHCRVEQQPLRLLRDWLRRPPSRLRGAHPKFEPVVPETAPSGIPQGEGGGVCGAAGSSDAATAVPTPQAQAIQLRLSRFCARERCRYRRPAQRFGQNYSRIGHFNSNCSD
jgi:hypothetical protein